MSWGTDFNANIFLNRIVINNVQEAIDRIEEENNNITRECSIIKMLASSTPKDIIPEEYKDSPFVWINITIDDCIENILASQSIITNLQHYINRDEKV